MYMYITRLSIRVSKLRHLQIDSYNEGNDGERSTNLNKTALLDILSLQAYPTSNEMWRPSDLTTTQVSTPDIDQGNTE